MSIDKQNPIAPSIGEGREPSREELRARLIGVLVQWGVTFSSRSVIYRHQVERFHEEVANDLLEALDFPSTTPEEEGT